MANQIPWWGRRDGATAWDTLYLSGEAVPGVAKVSVRVSQKLDVKKVKGATGAILRYEGYEPAEVNITIKIWMEIHVFNIMPILARIRPKKGEAPTAFDASHPALEMFDIRSIYVKDATSLEETEPGLYETKWSCLEFLPIPKGGKSKTTKATTDLTAHDTPASLPNPLLSSSSNAAFSQNLGILPSNAKSASELFAPSKDPKKSGP